MERTLQEGDTVEGFVVLETAGHAPGHLAFWREDDRVLIVGDALVNMNPLTRARGLHEPPAGFTLDRRQHRESIRRLAALRPHVICFGHGPVLRSPEPLIRLAEQLEG